MGWQSNCVFGYTQIFSFISCSSVNLTLYMVITYLSILPFFIAVAIFHLSSCKYNVPEVSQSTPNVYLLVKSSPIIKGCFNFVHMIKLHLKLGFSMFIVKCNMPIGSKDILLAVFFL